MVVVILTRRRDRGMEHGRTPGGIRAASAGRPPGASTAVLGTPSRSPGRGGVRAAVRDADVRPPLRRAPVDPTVRAGRSRRAPEEGVPEEAALSRVRVPSTEHDLAAAIVVKLKEEQATRAAAEAAAAASRAEAAQLRSELAAEADGAAAARAAAEAAAAACRTETAQLRSELAAEVDGAAAARAAAAAARAEADRLHADLSAAVSRCREQIAVSEAAESAAAASAQIEVKRLRSELSRCREQIAERTAATDTAAAAAAAAATTAEAVEAAERVETELRQKVQRLTADLAAAELGAATLEKDITKHKLEAERAGQRAALARDQIDEVTTRFTNELLATRKVAKAHEEQAGVAKRTCTELSKELEAAKQQAFAATVQVDDVTAASEQALPALREVLSSQSAAQATAHASMVQLEANLHASQLESAELRRELEQERSAAAALVLRVTESEAEMTQVMTSSSQAVETARHQAIEEGLKAAQFEAEYNRLEAELGSLTEEVESLKDTAVANDALQEEVEHLRTQRLDRDMAALQGGTRARVMELETSLQDRAADISRLSQQVDGLLKEKVDLQATLGQLRTSMDDSELLQADIAALERKHEHALQNVRREHVAAEEREAENNAIALRSLKAEASAQADAFEASRAEHRKALAASQEEVAHLREQAAVSRERLLMEHETARERLLTEQEVARGRIEAECTERLATAAVTHAASLAAAERATEQVRSSRSNAEASASAAHEAEMTNLRRSHAAALSAADVDREAERVRLTDAHAQSLALLEGARIEHKEAMGELRENHLSEMARLSKAHEADIAHLAEQQKVVLAGLSAEQQERATAMESLRRQHSQNLVAVDTRHAAAIESLNVTQRNALARQAAESAGALQAAKAQHDVQVGELTAAHAVALRELKTAHAEAMTETEEQWQAKLTEATRAHSSAEEEQEAAAGAALGILSEQQARLLDLQQTSTQQARALEAIKAEHAEEMEAARQREATLRQAGQAQQEAQEAELMRRDGEEAQISAALETIVAERTRLEGEVETWRAQSISLRAELAAVHGSEAALQQNVAAMFGQVVEGRLRRLDERRKRIVFVEWMRYASTQRLRGSLTWALHSRLSEMRTRAVLAGWQRSITRRREIQLQASTCWAAMEQRHLRTAVLAWRRCAWLMCVSRRCVLRHEVRSAGLFMRAWAVHTAAAQLERKAEADRNALLAAAAEQQASWALESQEQRASEIAAMQAVREAGQNALVEANEAAVRDAQLRAAEAEAAIATLREDATRQIATLQEDSARQITEVRETSRAEALQVQRALEEKIAKHAAGREAAKRETEAARREATEAAKRFDREVILSWEEIARLRGVDAENKALRAEVEELSSISLTVGQLRQRADNVVSMRRAQHAEAEMERASDRRWWEANGPGGSSTGGVPGVVTGAGASAGAAAGVVGGAAGRGGGGAHAKFRQPPPHLGSGRGGASSDGGID
jgi:hypothetical protein